MDLFTFIHHADLTKVKISEKQIEEGQTPLLESTKGRMVSHMPKKKTSEESLSESINKLFDEDDTADQEDRSEGDDHATHTEHVVQEAQDVAAEQIRATRKKKKGSGGASGSTLPPKKLRADYGTSDASTGGKSVVADLLERSTLAAEVGVTAAATVPFVTSFVISSDSSDHSGTNVVDVKVDSIIRSLAPPSPIMTTTVTTTDVVGALSLWLLVIPILLEWSFPRIPFMILKRWTLRLSAREMIDHLAPPALFSQNQDVDYDQLFTEFNVGTTRQTCLNAKVRMRIEYYHRERKREAEAAKAICLRSQVSAIEAMEKSRVDDIVVDKENELADLNVKVASLKSHNDGLADQVHVLEGTYSRLRAQVLGYKQFKEQYEAVQDAQVKILSDKVARLDANLMAMALHLDEEFYPCFLTTVAGRRWILGRKIKLAIMKCLHSQEYLAAVGATIGRAIDKGMQDGLVAGIDHGKARWSLADKDTSIEDIINLLRLEGPAAEIPEISQLQPDVECVHSRVERIRGNAAAQRLSLADAMVPLVEPLSAENLIGVASTSGMPATIAVTTALSTTFA
ncbi:hypothetical protein Tco_1194088 [Tanacetum coccineum]